MPRYIDADSMLENLKKQYGEELGWQCKVNMSDVGRMIQNAPAADVEGISHGEWLLRHIGAGHYWECSVCHKNPCIYVTEFTKYCPNCGARMDGDKNERK